MIILIINKQNIVEANMKKIVSLLLALVMLISISVVYAEDITLTMGSWNIEDTDKIQKVFDKYYDISGVKIKFEGTQATQYNANLRLQLDNGTGPDLWYSRSYKTGQELFDAGFAMDLTDLKGIQENFSESAKEAWRTDDGKMFAVPYAAVNHEVFYNTHIFEEQGLQVPTTYEQFIEVCQKLKDAGITPLANGVKSKWDVLECVFLGMLPNYVGGAENRVKYERLEQKMNDEVFKQAITDFGKLGQFLPEGFEAIENGDSKALFGTGQAAMFIDGSWTVDQISEQFGLDTFSAFAIPAPEKNKQGMCFHADFGMAGNAATKHPEEVKAFLEWIASPEGVKIAVDALPGGYFPMINAEITMNDERANEILSLNNNAITDVRFIWPKLLNAYTTMQDNLINLWLGEATVDQVADAFASAQEEALKK